MNFFTIFRRRFALAAASLRTGLAGLLVLLAGCSQTLQDININPTRPTTIDPNLLLATCEMRLAGESLQSFSAQYGSLSCVAQHLAPVYHTEFDLYRPTLTSTDRDVWQFLYSGYYNMHSPLRLAQEIIEFAADKPEYSNVRAAARVLRTLHAQKITDLFGDVPYFDAGKGDVSGTPLAPQYDAQEAIYTDMLKELSEAASAFDATKPKATNDAIYQGDAQKWRLFANTLRLRMALRISKTAPELARKHGEEAIRGGVFASNADNAYTEFVASNYWYRNTLSPYVLTEDWFALSDTFVEYLQRLNDPRLVIFSDKIPALGLPNGLYREDKVGVDGSDKRASRPSKHFAPPDFSGVNMILRASEAQFLLAEAALKGWAGTQPAQTHYERGVRLALAQYSVYPNNPPEIAAAQADAYLQGKDVAFSQASALEQIHTQKWIALFGDGYEPYAEYRRTGFPRLKRIAPVTNITGGAFPRRLLYPPSEFTFNEENVKKAISAAGAGYETMTARVWWDK